MCGFSRLKECIYSYCSGVECVTTWTVINIASCMLPVVVISLMSLDVLFARVVMPLNIHNEKEKVQEECDAVLHH